MKPRMSPTKRLGVLALGAAAILALSACFAPAGSDGEQGERLRVVATTTQVADFAAQVGGDDIELTGLLAPGASAHHFDPSPAELLALGRADVLIVNGAGLEQFLDSAIEASGFSGAVIDASEGIDLDLAREITVEGGGAHDHGEAHDHAVDDHADEDHAHEEGEGHDDGELNPHLWTSPSFAQGMVHEIARGLGEADPANAEAFDERARDYAQRLEQLDAWIAAQFERVPAAERVLVTGHNSMLYYLHDYDIAFAGSLLPSFEDNAEPSAAEIDALIDAIEQHRVRAIFVESSLSPKLAQTVGRATGATVVGDDSLFVDSLGPEGSGADTYIDAMVHNTRVILEAWGVTPDPLPSLQAGA